MVQRNINVATHHNWRYIAIIKIKTASEEPPQ